MGGGYKQIAYVLWVDELKHHRVKKAFESIDAIDEGLASLVEAVVREETDKALDPDRPGLDLIDDAIEPIADNPESFTRARRGQGRRFAGGQTSACADNSGSQIG